MKRTQRKVADIRDRQKRKEKKKQEGSLPHQREKPKECTTSNTESPRKASWKKKSLAAIYGKVLYHNGPGREGGE